jgi:hypothetical protein
LRWRCSRPLLILLGLSACTTVSPAPTDTFCSVYSPITASNHDTSETRRQIDANNGKYVCICEHDCPAISNGPPTELVPWLKGSQ